MCLSTVYSGDTPTPENMLAEYVVSVETEGDLIRLLDITGEELALRGSLRLVDLVANHIFINMNE